MRPSRWNCPIGDTPAAAAGFAAAIALAERDGLPIAQALPGLITALEDPGLAVLIAPPGAGKTTIAPLALLDQPWATAGRIIVLEPRRLAARAAAGRMADLLGEPVGRTVGYRVRMDSKVSSATRIEVVTEGVFTRMILDDPGLDGVVAVLFDEFHERSLDADLGLALAADARSVLREDLRILVMSATLDGAAVAQVLGGAPLVESHGRMFPVEDRYLGRPPQGALDEAMERAIRSGLQAGPGSVLAFLPGQAEILRLARRLSEQLDPGRFEVLPLYGAMDLADQNRAVKPGADGVRRIVLATSIAQTSLTLPDVRIVVDSGLIRAPRWNVGAGASRLTTVRASRATVEQRRGRAGRTAPGVCLRLWDQEETRALPPFERPEILESDLARLALDLAAWGAADADALAFLDRPPAAAMQEARGLLQRFGTLDAGGTLTAHGRRLAGLPLSPRLGQMLLTGARWGRADRAALLAALIGEPGLGGRDADLSHRMDRLLRDRSPRAKATVSMAMRWARQAAPNAAAPSPTEADWDGLLLAQAFPDRIAKARGGEGEFQLSGGRGAMLDPTDALARESWLAVAEVIGGGARDRILSAARLDLNGHRDALAELMVRETRMVETGGGRLRAREILSLGVLVVEEGPLHDADPQQVLHHLLDQLRRRGLDGLPWSDDALALRRRVGFLRAADPTWPDLSDAALIEALPDWAADALSGKRGLAEVTAGDVGQALAALIPWDRRRELDQRAPARWTAPTGTSVEIDWAAEGGPRIEVRVQELFGLTRHPTVGEGVPLALSLLSPARREIQVTRDLPGFWTGSWADVRKDMRGRYPKHPWPEDPSVAPPTTRAKPRGT